MSNHKYVTDTNNLFEDVDDEDFLKNSRVPQNRNNFQSSGNYQSSASNYTDQYSNNSNYNQVNGLQQDRQKLLEQKREIEERTVASSSRSIALLRDSEQIGIATAEELIRQREQLENSSKRLDEINTTLRFSQKHINGIKSVFGSLKNYLSGQKDEKMSQSVRSSMSDMTSETRKLNLDEQYANHPSVRLRNGDCNGCVPAEQSNAQYGGSKNMNAILEANLEEMSGNINRLKGLARGLGDEIDYQNDLLDNITNKTEQADFSLGKQNRDITKLMK